MIETADSPRAGRVADVQVGAATERLDSLIEKLFGLSRALFGHQELIVLRRAHRRTAEEHSRQHRHRENLAPAHPQRKEPPFTLIISPVTKVAKSETAKRIGPAISSGVATRLRGYAASHAFALFLSADADFHMSVSTKAGATQFTKILWRASSAASPLVKLMIAPLVAE